MRHWISRGLALSMLALAACSQSNSPSDQVEEVGEELVSAVEAAAGDASEVLGVYAPRDECSDIEGADNFVQRLALAVEARDAEGVAVLAAEDVVLDFGGGSGRAELRRRLDAPGGELWRELGDLGRLGCAASSDGGITLPWYFAQDIPVDTFKGMIVTGTDISLRSSPSDAAGEVARLNWDAVEIADSYEPEEPYQKVIFGDQEGYVATGLLRSVVDYRLLASSRNGRWRITHLVAGD